MMQPRPDDVNDPRYRKQLTAAEQIRATALWLALVVDDATPEDRVIDQAERYAAYIRGERAEDGR